MNRFNLSALAAALLLTMSLAANLSPIRIAADSLFSAGEHELAITEYKRYLCYEALEEVGSQTWKNLALCHRETKEYDKALQAIEAAISLAPDAQKRAEFTLEKAVTLMASGNLSHAELILIRLTLRQDAPQTKNLAGWWLTVNQSLQGKWTDASKTFSELVKILGMEEDPQVQETLDLFASFAKITPKKPAKAKLLSSILPGTGQLYGKDYKNALNSFAVNAGFVLWLTGSIIKQDFIGALPIALLGWRYYQGGRNNAEQGVIKFNFIERKNRSQQILRALEPVAGSL